MGSPHLHPQGLRSRTGTVECKGRDREAAAAGDPLLGCRVGRRRVTGEAKGAWGPVGRSETAPRDGCSGSPGLVNPARVPLLPWTCPKGSRTSPLDPFQHYSKRIPVAASADWTRGREKESPQTLAPAPAAQDLWGTLTTLTGVCVCVSTSAFSCGHQHMQV